jgi:Lipase
LAKSGCDPYGKFAIVIHGWKESCEADWIKELMKNLKTFRGGCIICMDYSTFSQSRYTVLVRRYRKILNVLRIKLVQLQLEKFLPINGYMFGFSFGAHLAVNAAIRGFGVQKLGELDGTLLRFKVSGKNLSGYLQYVSPTVCEPARPLFDRTIRSLRRYSAAAKNVQCIHTSWNFGTHTRTCHQNWNMGHCGMKQIGAVDYPYGSHGLCPHFYNSAFINAFEAIDRPAMCSHIGRTASSWPPGYRMGYTERRKS